MKTQQNMEHETTSRNTIVPGAGVPCTRQDPSLGERLLARKITDAKPGSVRLIIIPTPSKDDPTQRLLERSLDENAGYVTHVNCAGKSSDAVLAELDEAVVDLLAHADDGRPLALLCYDLPSGSEAYHNLLSVLLETAHAANALVCANVSPTSEPTLDQMCSLDRMEPCNGAATCTAQSCQDIDLHVSSPDLFLPALATTEEVASITRVKPEQVRRLIKRGEIGGVVHVGPQLRVRTRVLLEKYGITAQEALPHFSKSLNFPYNAYVTGNKKFEA